MEDTQPQHPDQGIESERELVIRKQGSEQEAIVVGEDRIEMKLYRLTGDVNESGEIVGKS